MSFTVNGDQYTVDVPENMPLLWVLRDRLGLTGTKYGCGIGECGSCTVHVDDDLARSCLLPASAVAGRSVTTIEGLSADGSHPVQQAWVEHRVPQCGYCQPGFIMTVAWLLDHPGGIMPRVLCRCGTYQRITAAIADLERR